MVSDVEKKAIDYVKKKLGGEAKDVSKDGVGYDLEYENKRIEVKGRGGKTVSIVHLSEYNKKGMNKAREDGKEYWLYIVRIIDDNNMKLCTMNVTEIKDRAKEKIDYCPGRRTRLRRLSNKTCPGHDILKLIIGSHSVGQNLYHHLELVDKKWKNLLSIKNQRENA